MTIRDHIVREALSWQNTAWHHRQCLKGIGTDCVMLCVGIAKAVGLLPAGWTPPFYSSDWYFHHNEEVLLAVLVDVGCRVIAMDARQPGDILTFTYGRVTSHVGILVASQPDYVVHAARNHGRVVHQRLAGPLLARLRQVYCFPGMEHASVNSPVLKGEVSSKENS